MLGWSGELPNGNWRKVEIYLDETDLRRLFVESDIPPDLAKEVPATTAFRLLEVEAQRLLLAELIQRFPEQWNSTEKRQELGALTRLREDTVQKLRASSD